MEDVVPSFEGKAGYLKRIIMIGKFSALFALTLVLAALPVVWHQVK